MPLPGPDSLCGRYVQDVRGVMGAQRRRAAQPTAMRQSTRSTTGP
jgi:hypothetical protein